MCGRQQKFEKGYLGQEVTMDDTLGTSEEAGFGKDQTMVPTLVPQLLDMTSK